MPVADWISDPISGHTHGTVVPLEPERALSHALSIPVASDRLVWTLFKLRGLSTRGTIEQFMDSGELGFHVLDRTPTTITTGIATRVWPPRARRPEMKDPADWSEWATAPGSIRAAMDLRARGGEMGWSELVTETRVDASDEAAARVFRLYWLAVREPSKLIRRRWLRAMAERGRAVGAR